MNFLKTQRHLFDIPSDIAYFNCAYNAPQLNESKSRLLFGVNAKSHPWERSASNFFEDAETIRQLAADIFGGNADGYALIPAASYGLSTAARVMEPQLKKGDHILMIAEEFPSNVLPWKRVAQETGAVLVTVPKPANGNWAQAIVESLTAKVKVLALSTCHWTNGAFIDLVTISKVCKTIGCVLVVDATQSLGAMPFPLDEIKPDFLVSAGYKWLLCPYGFGLLYVAEQWRNARPLEETWLARQNAEDFANLVHYSDTYMPGSRRFDVGEKCTTTILPGAIAALEQIKAWTVPAIANTLWTLNNQIEAHLEQLGFQIPPALQRCPHLFGALLPKHYKGNLVAELKAKNIFISQRGDSLRFSPHLHINEKDLHRLLESLTELVKKY